MQKQVVGIDGLNYYASPYHYCDYYASPYHYCDY